MWCARIIILWHTIWIPLGAESRSEVLSLTSPRCGAGWWARMWLLLLCRAHTAWQRRTINFYRRAAGARTQHIWWWSFVWNLWLFINSVRALPRCWCSSAAINCTRALSPARPLIARREHLLQQTLPQKGVFLCVCQSNLCMRCCLRAKWKQYHLNSSSNLHKATESKSI